MRESLLLLQSEQLSKHKEFPHLTFALLDDPRCYSQVSSDYKVEGSMVTRTIKLVSLVGDNASFYFETREGKRVESVLRMHFHWLAMHHQPFEVSRSRLPSYCPAAL